jgi:hypothetical protein
VPLAAPAASCAIEITKGHGTRDSHRHEPREFPSTDCPSRDYTSAQKAAPLSALTQLPRSAVAPHTTPAQRQVLCATSGHCHVPVPPVAMPCKRQKGSELP